MKKNVFRTAFVLGGLVMVMMMTLVGCSAPTDHVGVWNVIEKDGKALAEGASIQYFFCADNFAAKNEITEKDYPLNLYSFAVERNGNELTLNGIENDSETWQVEVLKANGKEQMKLTNDNGSLLLEKTGESKSAIDNEKYKYLYYPVIFTDEQNGQRMTLRFFCNNQFMFDSYQMAFEFDSAEGVLAILYQGNRVMQAKVLSETEWEMTGPDGNTSVTKVKTTRK